MAATWNVAFGLVLLAFLELLKVDATCPAPSTAAPLSVPKASCATYSPTYEDGSLSFCHGLVNYPFYLQDGATQQFMDELAEQNLIGSNPQAGLLLSILPSQCSNQLKKTVCLAVFQRCEYVDPAFLNSYCGPDQYCGACGDVADFPSSYGSVCKLLVGDTIVGSAVPCAAGPGKVPGLGNIGWELARDLSPAPSATMEQFCGAQNLIWSEEAKSCLAPIPRSPCKEECDKLWTMDPSTATCPLISGNWHDKLVDWSVNSEDAYVVDQAEGALARETDDRSSVSLLGVFGLAPDCNDNAPGDVYKLFSEDFTQTFVANSDFSVGGAIALSASAIGSKSTNRCHCVLDRVQMTEGGLVESSTSGTVYKCDSTRPANYCTHLATQTSRCNKQTGIAKINSNVGIVGLTDEGMIPQCKKVVTDPANQPDDVTLQLMTAAFGLPSVDLAKGAFFIPPAPGLPVLATGSMERNLCLMTDQSNPTKSYTGKNSYECAIATVKSAAELVPPFIRGGCRAAFHDMLCNMAHMKLEIKHLCLLPNGDACELTSPTLAATQNKIPFVFALPRFPSSHLCTNFKHECADFLNEFVGPIGTPKRNLLEATFNCTGKIQSSCLRNNAAAPWESDVWECTGQFNVLDQFPATHQIMANINGLLAGLGTYVADNNLNPTLLAGAGASSTTNQTISAGSVSPLETCACPAPLVVPDDPNAPLENPLLCCAQRCEGHMYAKAEFDSIITVQKVFSILSIIGTSFIIATWSLFKVKRSQPLTLLFAIASFNISLAFIIPDYSYADIREVWCKDNTQPHTQADGGMCLFQSIWITFWVLCACSFWMVQGFDLFLRIVKNQRHLDHMTKYYHMFGWGVPIIILAIILGSNAGGYRQTFFWCFMAEIQDESLGTALDLGLFYGTIITIWFFGAAMMTVVLYKIYQITSKTSGTAQVSNTTMKRLALYRTPVFFVIFFVYVWASIFAWRFDNETKKPAIRDSGLDWAQCLLTNFAAGIPDPATNPLANSTLLVTKYGIPADSGCGETYPVGIKYSDYIYLMCVTGLQGVFIFIIFGAKIENFNLWKERLGLTTKKYDTTADQDSSTKDKTAKPSVLSNAMSSMFQPSSPQPKTNDSVGEQGGSAVMVNGLQSGKFMAVTEADSLQPKVKNNQVAAAYMAE